MKNKLKRILIILIMLMVIVSLLWMFIKNDEKETNIKLDEVKETIKEKEENQEKEIDLNDKEITNDYNQEIPKENSNTVNFKNTLEDSKIFQNTEKNTLSEDLKISVNTKDDNSSKEEPQKEDQKIVDMPQNNIQESDKNISNKINMTAKEIVEYMKIGWNLGNSLDSTNYKKEFIGSKKNITYYETLWGNPITTKEMITKLAQAGFNSIRLPVTYYDHMKDGKIDKLWLDRVEEVINYIIDNNMYCILDIHHDTGLFPGGSYITSDAEKFSEESKKLQNMWTQIANRFKNYDYHLLFEGFNEIVDTNKTYDWVKGYKHTMNVYKLNQVFVDTVRKTGGNNKDRFLVVSTFGHNTDEQKLETFYMPKDESKDKIILALHDYANTKKDIDSLMNRINKHIVSRKIPVIIDEFGNMANKPLEKRAEMTDYYVKQAKNIGVTLFWWDNGNKNEYGLLNRNTLTWEYKKVLKALIQ